MSESTVNPILRQTVLSDQHDTQRLRESMPRGEAMDTSNLGFDPTQFTTAPLQTEGWIQFTDPADQVFARLADHEAMTEWLPLLKQVTVTHPQAGSNGESSVGTTRTLVFQGGLTLVERIVYWNPPLCYAYDTHGKVFPLNNYIGLMAVEPRPDGGTFIFREYYEVSGRIGAAVIPHGVVLVMQQAFEKLCQLIGGTDCSVKHASVAG
jgi:hypothetical protein